MILALLAGQPDGLATAALAACGIAYDQMAASHRARGNGPPPAPARPPSGLVEPSPACRELLGRAQALAAARGDPDVGSEHVLLAWLWKDEGQAVVDLELLGTTASAALQALATQGAAVPAVSPPEPDRRPWGHPVRIPVDRLNEVKAGLL